MGDNPTALDLKTLEAVPGIIILQALDKQRTEIYEEMTEKLDDVKEMVGSKIDALAEEMREGFTAINKKMNSAEIDHALMQVQVNRIETTTKENHKKVSTTADLLDKITDPKRAAVLGTVLTVSYAWIKNRGAHLLPWLEKHPNTESLLQVAMGFLVIIGCYYVLRALPTSCESRGDKNAK